jgi:hypothetical protein
MLNFDEGVEKKRTYWGDRRVDVEGENWGEGRE